MNSINKAYLGRRSDISTLVPINAYRILDAGCSNGTLGEQLLNDNQQREIIGIEYNDIMAREAKEKLHEVYIADLNTFHWNNTFAKSYFDCIIFSDVLEHLIDPWAVLSEASKHLSKNGTVVISIPNIRHATALHSIFIKGSFPTKERGIFDRTHLRWFTYNDIKTLCSQAGLSIQAVSPNLRLLDTPGGKVNAKFEKWLKPFSKYRIIHNFFAYQYVIRAVKTVKN